MRLLPLAHVINNMFVGVKLCVVDVVGIKRNMFLQNLGKDVESLPVHVPHSLMDNYVNHVKFPTCGKRL